MLWPIPMEFDVVLFLELKRVPIEGGRVFDQADILTLG